MQHDDGGLDAIIGISDCVDFKCCYIELLQSQRL